MYAPVAQWIERLTSDQKVVGSSPAGGAERYFFVWVDELSRDSRLSNVNCNLIKIPVLISKPAAVYHVVVFADIFSSRKSQHCPLGALHRRIEHQVRWVSPQYAEHHLDVGNVYQQQMQAHSSLSSGRSPYLIFYDSVQLHSLVLPVYLLNVGWFSNASANVKIVSWCGYGESNPDLVLGKDAFYH